MRAADGYAMAKRLFGGLTEAEIHFVVLISLLETGLGDGWGSDPERGAGSNNMGAVTAPNPASWPHGTFRHVDHDEHGKAYVTDFRKYPSKEAGLLDMALILLKPNVRGALAMGDGLAAVARQRENGYFKLKLPAYQAKAADMYAKMIASAGLPAVLSFTGSHGHTAEAVAGAVGVGLLLWYLHSRQQKRRRGRAA